MYIPANVLFLKRMKIGVKLQTLSELLLSNQLPKDLYANHPLCARNLFTTKNGFDNNGENADDLYRL